MNRAEVRRRQAEEISNILTLLTILVIVRLTGHNGAAYMIVALEVFWLLWSILGGSLSDTLGKLLRSRRNKGQYKNGQQMRRSAMICHAVLGILGSLTMFLLAGPVAEEIFRIPCSTLILMVISPILLLRSISAVIIGYFYGEGTESLTAVAGVMRQIFTLAFGFLFYGILKGYGKKVSALLQEENYTSMYGGVGFAIAMNLAELLVIFFLGMVYKGSRRLDKRSRQDNLSAEPMLYGIGVLWASRWQQCIIKFLETLPLVLGVFLFCRASELEAVGDYGMYAGIYLSVCGIASFGISASTIPIIGKTYAGIRREESKAARNLFQTGVHICLVHGIFGAVFVAVMGTQLLAVISPESSETALQMLLGGSTMIIFMALSSYFKRFLLIAGKKMPVMGAVGIGDMIYMIIVMITFGIGKAGILSLVYGGMAGMFVICILLGMLSYRQMRMRIDWLQVLVIPLGGGGVAGLLCMLFSRLFALVLPPYLTLLLALAVAGVSYWVVLLLLRNFRDQELDVMPGGRLVIALGRTLRLI